MGRDSQIFDRQLAKILSLIHIYYHIPASIFSNYTFGHHEAVLFKEFPLGTQYVVDYLLAGRASGGWQFIFVEFENPYNNIVVKDGDWGMTVRKGLKQIRDWQAFIAANYAVLYEEFKKYTPKILTCLLYTSRCV